MELTDCDILGMFTHQGRGLWVQPELYIAELREVPRILNYASTIWICATHCAPPGTHRS